MTNILQQLFYVFFHEGNNRIKPVLLFKGAGSVAAAEEKHSSPAAKVLFTSKSFIDRPTMEKYMS